MGRDVDVNADQNTKDLEEYQEPQQKSSTQTLAYKHTGIYLACTS